MVTMTRDMRPFRENSTPVVPDDVAAQMEAEGACTDVRPWPAGSAAAPVGGKPGPARGYKTKGGA